MTFYNVHIYREMRLYFPAITADTPGQAARIAADRLTAEAEYTEDCDGENLAALIDLVGDDEFTQSVTIDFDSERLRKAAPDPDSALPHPGCCGLDFRGQSSAGHRLVGTCRGRAAGLECAFESRVAAAGSPRSRRAPPAARR